jgi:hypothetical protein
VQLTALMMTAMVLTVCRARSVLPDSNELASEAVSDTERFSAAVSAVLSGATLMDCVAEPEYMNTLIHIHKYMQKYIHEYINT